MSDDKRIDELERAHAIIAAYVEKALITPRDPVWNAEWLVEHQDMAINAIYQQSQTIAALEAERDGLRDKVYDLLSLRHGSIDARRVKVNEAIGQDGE